MDGSAAEFPAHLYPMPAGQEPYDAIRPLIRVIRGKRVILDADLARLYGVAPKQFNQALR